MKYNIVLFTLFAGFSFGFTQTTEEFFKLSDTFFKENVSHGKVDYSKIHDNPESLNMLTDLAALVSVSKTNDKVYQAFWINAYNIFVIKQQRAREQLISSLPKIELLNKEEITKSKHKFACEYFLQYILRFICSFIVRFITIMTIFISKQKRQTRRFQKGTKKTKTIKISKKLLVKVMIKIMKTLLRARTDREAQSLIL